MKITVEIPDPTPASEAESNQMVPVSAPEKAAAIPAPEPKDAPMPKATAAPPLAPPKPAATKQPKVSEGKTSPPVVGNLLDRQGGVNDILDPSRGRPGFFKFEPPSKEGA